MDILKSVPVVFVAAIAFGLGGCAATMPTTAPQQNAVAVPAAAPTPAAAPSATAVATRQVGAIPSGFRRAERNGTEVFCQTRAVTGSRARSVERCYTREELRVMEENNARLWRDAQTGSSQSSLQLDSPR